MTSFAVVLEPGPQPRLATAALFVHGLAATSPWLADVAVSAAVALSLLAIGAFAATLARVPGPHSRLRAVVLENRGCHVRLAGERRLIPARVGAGSRAMPSLVYLEIRVGRRRFGWLLPRASLPDDRFRRLKARVRLTC